MTTYLVMDKLPLRKTKQKQHSGKYDERYLANQTPTEVMDYIFVLVIVLVFMEMFNIFHVITSIECKYYGSLSVII